MSAADVVGRPGEASAIGEFLGSTASWPTALLLGGEAGIGKTTLWSFGIERARASGIRVLCARTAAAESVLAYASLADLLSGVDTAVYADLPAPQRIAMDQVLLRGAGDESAATDPRAVAAGFLSVIEQLADESSVLIAIDDLQWLDTSSRQVVAFVARRLTGRRSFDNRSASACRSGMECFFIFYLSYLPAQVQQRRAA